MKLLIKLRIKLPIKLPIIKLSIIKLSINCILNYLFGLSIRQFHPGSRVLGRAGLGGWLGLECYLAWGVGWVGGGAYFVICVGENT